MICTLDDCERPARFVIHSTQKRYLGRSCRGHLADWVSRHTPVYVTLFVDRPVVTLPAVPKRLRRTLRRRVMRAAP